jgi:TIR domain
MKDFFISYNKADRSWAEWIAWQLEAANYTTVLQAWDFLPGSNFVLAMQDAAVQATRTIAVLSPNYLTSRFTQPEWATAFAQDPTGEQGLLVLVRVQDCDSHGLLPQLIYIDMVNLDESAARMALLTGLHRGRAKPLDAPPFPGATQDSIAKKPPFPGASLSNRVPDIGRSFSITDLHQQTTNSISNNLKRDDALDGNFIATNNKIDNDSTSIEDDILNEFSRNEVSVSVDKLEVEITINGDFDKYTSEDQNRLLRAIGELLNISEDHR